MTPTNDEFATAFKGLRTQAKLHGLDPNQWGMRAFLVQTAHCLAQERAISRQVMTIIHERTRPNEDNTDN